MGSSVGGIVARHDDVAKLRTTRLRSLPGRGAGCAGADAGPPGLGWVRADLKVEAKARTWLIDAAVVCPATKSVVARQRSRVTGEAVSHWMEMHYQLDPNRPLNLECCRRLLRVLAHVLHHLVGEALISLPAQPAARRRLHCERHDPRPILPLLHHSRPPRRHTWVCLRFSPSRSRKPTKGTRRENRSELTAGIAIAAAGPVALGTARQPLRRRPSLRATCPTHSCAPGALYFNPRTCFCRSEKPFLERMRIDAADECLPMFGECSAQ